MTIKRLCLLVTFVAAIAAGAMVAPAPASASCSSSNGYTTCKYWETDSLPIFIPVYSGYAYWVTNKMWRPVDHWAWIAFDNSAGHDNGKVIDYYDNPLRIAHSYGYDRAWCENADSSSYTATCQVYNWTA